MEAPPADTEVRLMVAQCLRTLGSSTDDKDVTAALQTLCSYLDEGPESGPTSVQRAEFRRAHYTRTLQFLIHNIQADWVHNLTAARRTELWDGLFLRGPPDQALLVLTEGIGALKWVLQQEGCETWLPITERFLQSGRLVDMLWSYCLGAAVSDSPQLRETLLGRIVALPDITANRLQLNNKPLFLPQQYYPLLANEMLTALERTCQALKDGTDCSLTFVAQTLGKVCMQGHSDVVLAVIAPRLSASTRSDMVWQRVCWKLLENVPQGWIESVLIGLVKAVTGPEAFGRIIGNLVLTNKKAQFVITHKLLLLQYKYETRVLRIVLGYLAADRERRPLLLQVSKRYAWANPSAVKHTPLEQQLYVSKALLLSVSLLRDSELQEVRSELMQCMLGGMQSHLDSSVVHIRRLGMVVGECLSSRIDNNGAKLKFEVEQLHSYQNTFELHSVIRHYDQDEETQELLYLMHPVTSNEPEPEPDDDEFTPYDMSGDQEISQASPPRYLRDCLETLMTSEDPVRVELSLKAAEGLVRKNVFTAKEISVQMTKVLLHIEDKYNINGFLVYRQTTMVALTVTDCIPVSQYLTTEFYSLNYSLRQRLDILEVLALAAQELSKPITEKSDLSIGIAASTDLTPSPGDNPVHWREVVEKRIQSKTKRLSKGAKPPAKASPNRFAPVAGHFFFPLLRNYDKPQVTFDLLGSDHLVLGRLIHTLGLFMHLAVNAPVVIKLMVRRGVLFAVCSAFLSMPSQNLLVDLSAQLFETRTWLSGKEHSASK
uniref:Telomere length regulation protein TEL2 homolog n=1 Tax=Echeneis naucrates TaxID=173247 RepID=A0A665V5B9_ECHNA